MPGSKSESNSGSKSPNHSSSCSVSGSTDFNTNTSSTASFPSVFSTASPSSSPSITSPTPSVTKKVILLRRNGSAANSSDTLGGEGDSYAFQRSPTLPSSASTGGEPSTALNALTTGTKSLEERTKEYHEVRARIFGTTSSHLNDDTDSLTTSNSGFALYGSTRGPAGISHDDRNDPAYIRHYALRPPPPPPLPPPPPPPPPPAYYASQPQRTAFTGAVAAARPSLSSSQPSILPLNNLAYNPYTAVLSPQPLRTPLSGPPAPSSPSMQSCPTPSCPTITAYIPQYPHYCLPQHPAALVAPLSPGYPSPYLATAASYTSAGSHGHQSQDNSLSALHWSSSTTVARGTGNVLRSCSGSPSLLVSRTGSSAGPLYSHISEDGSYSPRSASSIPIQQIAVPENLDRDPKLWIPPEGGLYYEQEGVEQRRDKEPDSDYIRDMARYERRYDAKGLSMASQASNYARVPTYDSEFPPLG